MGSLRDFVKAREVNDSELTNEAAVKALDQGVATTDSPTFAGGTIGGKDVSKAVVSDTTGVTGADIITNIISLTQVEYDAITPDAATLYVISE